MIKLGVRPLSAVPALLSNIFVTSVLNELLQVLKGKKKIPWPEFAIELYPPSDRRMSTKLVPTFADRVCHVVSATYPHGHILGFLDRSRYFFFHIAPQLYSLG
jgi:hypothetical protein